MQASLRSSSPLSQGRAGRLVFSTQEEDISESSGRHVVMHLAHKDTPEIMSTHWFGGSSLKQLYSSNRRVGQLVPTVCAAALEAKCI